MAITPECRQCPGPGPWAGDICGAIHVRPHEQRRLPLKWPRPGIQGERYPLLSPLRSSGAVLCLSILSTGAFPSVDSPAHRCGKPALRSGLETALRPESMADGGGGPGLFVLYPVRLAALLLHPTRTSFLSLDDGGV